MGVYNYIDNKFTSFNIYVIDYRREGDNKFTPSLSLTSKAFQPLPPIAVT